MSEQSPLERGPARPARRPFYTLLADTSPLHLQLTGRTLLHAAIIGAVAGLMAVFFFGALELVEELVLGGLTGYTPLRADGEKVFSHLVESPTARMWLLPVIPALGALAGGILTAKVAPEAAGGGGNAMIHAFRVLLDNPRIDPGVFALVGMGTFYGGIAHAPISSLAMVCRPTRGASSRCSTRRGESSGFWTRRTSAGLRAPHTTRSSPACRSASRAGVARIRRAFARLPPRALVR